MALHQSSKIRNASADQPVDVFPVTKEFLIGEAGLFGNAINQFDHRYKRICEQAFNSQTPFKFRNP